ncbi:hypothetical protein [Arhodomonas sp. AD133]|uniref:hypothetical protein n=1 Tax=Arhodomonas sp. AD133 TaxID=3415009 RepID=UPI003EBC6B6E
MTNRMILLVGAVAATVGLVGCASNGGYAGMSDQQFAELMDARRAVVTAQRPRVQCEAACDVTLPAYMGSDMPQLLPQAPTNGWDALVATLETVERVGVAGLPIWGMTEAVDSAVGIAEGISGPTQIHNGDTIGGAKVGRDYAGGDLVRGDMAGGDIAGRDAIRNSGRIASPNDSTHEPTVVEQPAPVIVDGGGD